MKKALIIYAIIFVVTMVIPAIVCFGSKSTSTSQEMVNLFRGVAGMLITPNLAG